MMMHLYTQTVAADNECAKKDVFSVGGSNIFCNKQIVICFTPTLNQSINI